jgi:hypothetical protein
MSKRVPNARAVISTLVILDQNISTEELRVELAELGHTLTPLAISIIKANCVGILGLLQSMGRLNDVMPEAPAWLKQHRKASNRPERRVSLDVENGPPPRRHRYRKWKSTFKKWDFPG